MKDFKTWYEEFGQPVEDAVREWIEAAPEDVEILELLGDPEAYVQDLLQTAYGNYLGDYTDNAHASQRDAEFIASGEFQ